MFDAWRRHERLWKDNRYVYAVVSRRSRGVSVGINLNPDKACNFNCIYCQVNRRIPSAIRRVDLGRLAQELDAIIQAESNGSLYVNAPFDVLNAAEHEIRDIAFSGDGEPTKFHRFEAAVRIAADARRFFGLNSTKLVLLTNAAYLHKPAVRAALSVFDKSNGEIWAKLDAGSEEYFHLVNRSNVSLQRILDNILDASRIRPLVIQSLFLRIRGAAPPAREIEAYCGRLNHLLAAGSRLKLLQLYTVVRDPADISASPLSNDELEHIASAIRSRVQVPVDIFPGF